ncbi:MULTISPECIES: hypothetical protein [Rhizobium]|uniref:Endonuclease protein n=1 Tax=Rhizobium favelukesii TaxID=348824 RepID=W6RNZ9_9HYPH|nr:MULTISPECIES: hypothetical protein [Rhizobium]MCA0804165.1 hypothetical protein [Rhizobium sp. T1473]MCS0459983.1 hypothetical protein [Rhizobium favelukesii]UFS82298.1 hypothetical protein LPB79_29175 [Rhizobium sp. T136]CDM56016.1 putative endonuclease protein [Rhizobium favelukesii]
MLLLIRISTTVAFPAPSVSAMLETGIDDLFLSLKLLQKIERGGVFGRGAWPGSRPKRWDTYPQLKHAASDHAAIWVDLDI